MPRQKLSMLTMATSVPMSLNVLLCGQTSGQDILAPLPRQSSRIRDDPMDHFHGGGGERTVMVVLTLDRCQV